MIGFIYWFLSIHLLLGVVSQMSKLTTELTPASILAVVRKYRPSAATGYRLVDSQNRLFPPLEQRPYNTVTRVENPEVPAGTYGIRFEDSEGNVLPYSEDGTLAEVELDGSALTHSPDELAVRRERGWQKVEKHETRYKAEHIRNEGLQGITGLLQNAHLLIFDSHKEVKDSQKHVAEMIRNFMELQRSMLEQQKAISIQAQAATPPPPQENWASAAPKLLRELGDVVKVAVMATTGERSQRGAAAPVFEAQTKPTGMIETQSSSEVSPNAAQAKVAAANPEKDPQIGRAHV